MHLVNATRLGRFHMRGLGLIELMISITLAGIIFIGMSALYAAHQLQNTRAEQYYLLQQEARNILTIMQRELARAGYKSNFSEANPFIYSDDEIYILNPSNDCILYRYDRNEDGFFSDESFGFRWHLGGLQLRKGSDVNCDAGLGWEMISDAASTDIIQLQFTVSQQLYSLPYRIKGIVTIELSIRHRQFPEFELNFVRNSSARALL